MRIDRIHIRGFGRWVDRVFEFPAGLSVWVGLNEAGKTTLVHAILAGLYGLAKRRSPLREIQDRYRPWDANAPFAVTLQLSDGAVQYRLERDFLAGTVRAFRKEGRHYLAEEEPEQLVARLVGLGGINLFRSTLLVTGGEVAAVQEGKPGEAVAAKAVSGDEAANVAGALRWLERELQELTKEGRTEATRSALQRARAQVARLEADLTALEEGAEREEVLLKELIRLEQEIAAEEEYLAKFGPLVQKYDEYREAREALAKERQGLEELVQEFAGIEKNQRLWEEARDQLAALPGQTALDPGRRKEEEALWLRYHTASSQAAEGSERCKRLAEEIRNLQMQLSGLSVEKNLDDRPSREGWARIRELTERQRLLREQLRENLRGPNPVRSLAGNKMLALAGIVAGIGLILPPLFLRALSVVVLLLLFLPAIVLIGLSLRALVLLSRADREAGHREEEERRLQAEVQRIDRELAGILSGRAPEEYLAELERAEAEERKAAELTGRLAVLREESRRLKEEEQNCRAILEDCSTRLKAVWQEAGVQGHEEYLAHCERYDHLADGERLARIRLEQSLRGKDYREWDKLIAAQTTTCRLLEAKAETLYFEADPLAVEDCRQQIAASKEKLPSLVQERAILKDRLQGLRQSFAGSDHYRTAAELAYWRLEVADLELRAEGIQLALENLTQAWNEVNARLTPMLVERTSALFARMTQGKYSRIRLAAGADPRQELPLEVALPDGGWVTAAALSSGTCDQLYMALRIALGEYLTGRTDFPLILDDPFIHFDPVRLAQTVQLLKELSANHQIIWLTKEPRIAQDFPELFVGQTQ